ncbi:MAG: hypothetical protein EON58_17030 [Alphaproteobacteria bacterium]|nr:MAG: hypothetical protein EON58_17030 [Alphaproteobacteria bacterium]
MTISQLHQDGQYPHRSADCKRALKLAVEDLIEQAQQLGWTTPESLDAIEELVAEFRTAYAEDPNPSEDPDEIKIL